MIFVTVGAQMPFDRLVAAVDRWAAREGRRDIFAQIGTGSYRPTSFKYVENMNPQEFRRKVCEADLVVAHAGMGSILTALEIGRPILVMPRRGDLMETRNDHQVATALKLSESGRIAVAMDESELGDRLRQMGEIRAAEQISPHASSALLQTLRRFIVGGTVVPRPVLVGEERAFQSDLDAEFAPHAGNAPVLVNS